MCDGVRQNVSVDEIFAGLISVMEDAAAMVRASPATTAERKGHQDYVTDVDLKLDQMLETRLGGLVAGAPVFSEERPATQGDPVSLWWIVDPIDGTGNLIAGLPFVGVAVALVDASGPLLAAVAAPFQYHMWTALRGSGAWLDGKPLELSQALPPDLVVASTGLLDRINCEFSEAWIALRRVGKLRNLGAQSLHLCGVASGWFAAALSIEAKIWDESAGGLIVREAGGIWSSAADNVDWTIPEIVFSISSQNSLAAHPAVAALLEGPMARIFAGANSG